VRLSSSIFVINTSGDQASTGLMVGITHEYERYEYKYLSKY